MNYKKTYWKADKINRHVFINNDGHLYIKDPYMYIMIDENYKRYFYRPGIGWKEYKPFNEELGWKMISYEELMLELL